MQDKQKKYILKSLESIKSYVIDGGSEIILPNYLNKLDQYKAKVSTNAIVLEIYVSLVNSEKLCPKMLNNTLNVLLMCYDNFEMNGKLGTLISNIYMDVLLTMIMISCTKHVDINTLKLFTDAVTNNFVDKFDPMYNFPLTLKFSPINYPLLAIVKLLNRKTKSVKYVNLLKKLVNSSDNIKINRQLGAYYDNAKLINDIPVINNFNTKLLTKINTKMEEKEKEEQLGSKYYVEEKEKEEQLGGKYYVEEKKEEQLGGKYYVEEKEEEQLGGKYYVEEKKTELNNNINVNLASMYYL